MSRAKGTGWIPDYPDIRDNTLSSVPLQHVVNTAGNETVATSLESLAGRITAAFHAILDAEANDNAAAALKQIEQEFLSNSLTFRPVQAHQYLATGTHSTEVLRIKAYLKRDLEALQGYLTDTLNGQVASPQIDDDDLEQLKDDLEQLKQDVQNIQPNDEWWFQQLADEQFNNLLKLYQLKKQHDIKKNDGSRNELENVSETTRKPHRTDGILDPETLITFEIEPTQKAILNGQLNKLRKDIEEIDPDNPKNIEETIEQLAEPKAIPAFYKLHDLQYSDSDNFNQLTEVVQGIQQKYYARYLEQALPQSGIDLIKSYEGLELQAYLDSIGVWTIGYGHTADVYPGQTISESQAEQILRQDLLTLANKIRASINPDILYNSNHFGALLSFAFNVGIGALEQSQLFKLFNQGNFEFAAKQFQRWVKAGGTTLPGLVLRRKDEQKLFEEEFEPDEAVTYQRHHYKIIEPLIEQFKDSLWSELSAIDQLEPSIQVEQIQLSWQLPNVGEQRFGEAIFKCLQHHLLEHELKIEIRWPYLNDHNSPTVESETRTLKTERHLELYRSEITELMFPVIQALSQCLSPMGRHSEIHRAITQKIVLLNQILATDSSLDTDTQASDQETDHHARQEIKSVLPTAFQAVQQLSKTRLEELQALYQTCQEELEEAQKAHYEVNRTNTDSQSEAIDQDNLKRLKLAHDQAQQKSDEINERGKKYDIAAQILGRFLQFPEICSVLSAAGSLPNDGQPTLLYVPPLQMTSEETTGLFKNYANSLQMPLDSALKQTIKSFFPNPSAVTKQATSSAGSTAVDQQFLYLVLPEFVDLSYWCSPVEDQGSLNSCVAQAGVAMVEYFAKRTFEQHEDLSSRFLYKVARNLMHRQGDTGASLRETMRAMVLFGIPPEEHWPYTDSGDAYDDEPDQFCYAYAQNYQTIKYCRLDYPGISKWALLAQVKAVLVAGLPCMFGFTLYQSIHDNLNVQLGQIPLPGSKDEMVGGHAVVAVGYDDRRIVESADGSMKSQGALLIRNSWGAHWGQGGYGWLPYDYVISGLTADWWTLIKSEWFSSGQFGASVKLANSMLGTKTGTKDD